jgi:hypothetical protein
MRSPSGREPLPTPAEALDMPLQAFPLWSLRVICERCGQVRSVDAGSAPERRYAAADPAGSYAP